MRLAHALAALLATLPAAGRAADPAPAPVPAATVPAAPVPAADPTAPGTAAAAPTVSVAPAAAPAATAAAVTVPAAAVGPAVTVPAAAAPAMAVPTTTFPALGVPAASVPTLTVPAAPTPNQRDAMDARDAQAAGLPLPPDAVGPGVAAGPALAARGGNRVFPRWGLAVGAGFPHFGTASVVFRPVTHVRLSAGPSWNYAGWGVHGGVSLVPWNAWLTPVLALEGGRFFRSDVGRLVNDGGEDVERVKSLLSGVDFAYASLDVGLELGAARGFAFSVRAGLSYVSIVANGSTTYTSDDGSSVTIRDPALRGTLPSVKLGFRYWF
jgi:hypothetical protein